MPQKCPRLLIEVLGSEAIATKRASKQLRSWDDQNWLDSLKETAI